MDCSKFTSIKNPGISTEGLFLQYVIKLIKTNKNGIPDLVAIPPNCGVIFSEVKKPSGRVSAIQEYRLKELDKHGVITEVYRGEV